MRRTLRGALASLPVRAALVERAAVDQLSAAAELRAEADAAYAEALREVEAALRSGSLLRGEVLARWHEVVGTGDVMRALETRVGWLRDRLKSIVTGAPAADAELKVTVEHRVEAVVRTAAERAAERTARAWRERVPGRALLEGSPELERASTGLDAAAEEQVRAWQGVVFDLVREEGASKRATARLASLGVNGAGLTVMLAVFAQTGGLTGAEIIVAGGTSAVGQKVLEAIFGDQAVRTLASRAREDLIERIDRLLRAEAKRFDELLDASAPEADSFARLHTRRGRDPQGGLSTTLDDRLAALREAAELAEGRLDEADVEAARAVVAKAGARLGLGLESTVVALAGPTGVGKSALFNVLTGTELAAVGRRRPTTSAGQAAIWGGGADALLDWLEIGRRHQVDADGLGGLVLLDLPDFDSVETAHRVEAERVVALADLVLWIVEPQKYADASLHDRYLRPLATHAAAMAVVLNQADLLGPADVAAWRKDMERLLAEDGVPKLPLAVVSARTGDGVPELRRLLAERVAARDAAVTRLAADLERALEPLAAGCAGRSRGVRGSDREQLLAALEEAAGVPTVVRAVGDAHRRRGDARDRLAVRPLDPPLPARPAEAAAAARVPAASHPDVDAAADRRPARAGSERGATARRRRVGRVAAPVAAARTRGRDRRRRSRCRPARPCSLVRRPERLGPEVVGSGELAPTPACSRRRRGCRLAARARPARLAADRGRRPAARGRGSPDPDLATARRRGRRARALLPRSARQRRRRKPAGPTGGPVAARAGRDGGRGARDRSGRARARRACTALRGGRQRR